MMPISGPASSVITVTSLSKSFNNMPAMIPFALDHGAWTANADRLRQNLKASYRASGFNGAFELWVTGVTGTLSPTGKQELQARGFKVVEQMGGRIEIVD